MFCVGPYIHYENVLCTESGGDIDKTTSKLPWLLFPSSMMRYFLRLLSPVWGTAVKLGAIHTPLPKNLRPRATAPQTLNRSIRHTMLKAAGVWAVAAGACQGQRHVHYHKYKFPAAHPSSEVSSCFVSWYKTIDLFFCAKCSIVLLFPFGLFPIDPALCF